MAKEIRIRERNYRFTKHARQRSQQRGIPDERIGIMMEFGERSWSKGAHSFRMTKRARRRAARQLGRAYGRVADKFNFYLIICPDTGAIRTVAPRKRRMKRK